MTGITYGGHEPTIATVEDNAPVIGGDRVCDCCEESPARGPFIGYPCFDRPLCFECQNDIIAEDKAEAYED